MKISTNTTAWLAGINAFASGYILWMYYRAIQYVPQMDAVPFQLTGLQFGLIFFECVSLAVSIYYVFDRKSDTIKSTVLILCLVQLVALSITPFLIAAVTWPRVA